MGQIFLDHSLLVCFPVAYDCLCYTRQNQLVRTQPTEPETFPVSQLYGLLFWLAVLEVSVPCLWAGHFGTAVRPYIMVGMCGSLEAKKRERTRLGSLSSLKVHPFLT